MLLRFLEFLFFFIVAWFVWTQYVVPKWHGRKPFPLFGDRRKAEAKLADAREKADVERLNQLRRKIT